MKKFKRYVTNNKCKINSYPAFVNTKTGRSYGYINNIGKFIIPPRFSTAESFNDDGLAIVSEEKYYGSINTKGEYIVYPIYDSLQPFIEKRAIYTLGNIMGVLSEDGSLITSKPYTFISNYSDSLALVTIKNSSYNSLYGYIDRDGKEVIPPRFIFGTDFKDGYALIKDLDNLYKVIDKTGNIYTTFNYGYVGSYGEGVFTFSKEIYGLLGYVSLEGSVIIEPKFTSASPVEDGYMIVSNSPNFLGNYGVINLSNQTIYPLTFNSINYLGNKRFALGFPRDITITPLSNIYALGNEKGNILTPYNYLNIERYDNNIASAYNTENTFFIDLNGKILKNLPIVNGSGTLKVQCNLIYADVDFNPHYISMSGKIIYKANNNIKLDDRYTLLKLKHSPNVDYLVYYPQIEENENSTVQGFINYRLRKLSNLKKISRDEVLDYNLYGNFQILFFNKDLLVLEIDTYTYPFGAAHGGTIRSTPNINLITGEFYSLNDLFKGGIYWSNELNKIIDNMIKTNPNYESVYEGAFKGINENQSFYVDKDNLYIYFIPYEIAPYSSGFVTFKIPFKEIAPLINTNGSFYKSFN